MLSSGLVGVSTQTILVRPGWMAARIASESLTGAGAVPEPPAHQHLVEQTVRAAVGVVRDHHVVTGLAERVQQGVLGREPGGEREAAFPLLERGDVALEGGAGGVARSAVLVAAAQPPTPSCL